MTTFIHRDESSLSCHKYWQFLNPEKSNCKPTFTKKLSVRVSKVQYNSEGVELKAKEEVQPDPFKQKYDTLHAVQEQKETKSQH